MPNSEIKPIIPSGYIILDLDTLNSNFHSLKVTFEGTESPKTPEKGQIWYNSNINLLQVYNGTDWVNIMTSSGESIDWDDIVNRPNLLKNIYVGEYDEENPNVNKLVPFDDGLILIPDVDRIGLDEYGVLKASDKKAIDDHVSSSVKHLPEFTTSDIDKVLTVTSGTVTSWKTPGSVPGMRINGNGVNPPSIYSNNQNYSIVIGNNSLANNTYALAIGESAKARSMNSVALGRNADANGSQAVAIGMGASAARDNAICIGGQSDSINGITLGYGTYINPNITNGVALGQNAYCTESYTISVGQGNAPAYNHKITNLKAGTSDLDAVNLAQMSAAINSSAANPSKWKANEAYSYGDIVTANSHNNFRKFFCVKDGLSGSTSPFLTQDTTIGNYITDGSGTLKWLSFDSTDGTPVGIPVLRSNIPKGYIQCSRSTAIDIDAQHPRLMYKVANEPELVSTDINNTNFWYRQSGTSYLTPIIAGIQKSTYGEIVTTPTTGQFYVNASDNGSSGVNFGQDTIISIPDMGLDSAFALFPAGLPVSVQITGTQENFQTLYSVIRF